MLDKRERERGPKFKKLNFALLGIGVLTTASISVVVISCGNKDQDKKDTEQDKKDVDAITQSQIQQVINKEFADAKQTLTATQAKKAMTNTVFNINGVTITFKLEMANDANRKIAYTISEISKGNVKRAITDLEGLKGEIIGFRTQIEIDTIDQLIVNTIFKDNIKIEISKLFEEHIDKTASQAKNAITNRTFDINGATITFNLEIADDVNKKITYTISEISKGNVKRAIADLDGLKGEITGFKTQAWINGKAFIDDALSTTNQKATETKINTVIKDLFKNEWENTPTKAAVNIVTRQVNLPNGIEVEFTLTADENNSKIIYDITKLSKNVYSLSVVDHKLGIELNGEITGFKTQVWVDAKTLIDNAVNKVGTKEAIKAAIKIKLDATNNTASQAKVVFDALALDQRVVKLTNNADYNDIKVEFTITSFDEINQKITYTISKLFKDGYELTTGIDNLNGEITGFAKKANKASLTKYLNDYLNINDNVSNITNNPKLKSSEHAKIVEATTNYINNYFSINPLPEIADSPLQLEPWFKTLILDNVNQKAALEKQLVEKFYAGQVLNAKTIEINGWKYSRNKIGLTIETLHNNQAEKVNLDSLNAYQGIFKKQSKEVEFFNVTANVADSQFYDEDKLTGLKLPNVETIADEGFRDGDFTGRLTLPKVTSIGQLAFRFARFSGHLSLPKVKTIGWMAFSQSLFSEVLFLPVVETIDNDAFHASNFTKALSLPEVKSIGNRAFYKSAFSDTIYLPKAADIGSDAFFSTRNSANTKVTWLAKHNNDNMKDSVFNASQRSNIIFKTV